ncbi:MAG: TSUP family transporter [Candidatus Nanopelagicales bacterium]|nr:TSUP family transporter [Candidatus Nanopelagicales bacterium]
MEPLAVLAIAGVAAGGLAQSVTGLGFALVAAPGLIALLGPSQGVAVVVLLGILASVIPLLGQWRHVRVRDGGTLLVPTLLATPAVGALIAGVDTAALAVAAGTAVLVGVVALWRGLRWQPLVSIPGAIGTGIASATMNVIGGVGGPPVGLYAANAGWEPREARATLQGFFLIQGLATMLVIGPVLPDVAAVVALVVGTLVGVVVAPRIPERAARMAVLAVAGFGGLALIVGNL